jgi:hypothetical protein
MAIVFLLNKQKYQSAATQALSIVIAKPDLRHLTGNLLLTVFARLF